MSLWIKYKAKKTPDQYISGNRVVSVEVSVEWHLGEPIPEDIGRVVTFQADGDELNLFLNAMAASRGECGHIMYTKMSGFFKEEPAPLSIETLGSCSRLARPHRYDPGCCQKWTPVAGPDAGPR